MTLIELEGGTVDDLIALLCTLPPGIRQTPLLATHTNVVLVTVNTDTPVVAITG